MQGLDTKMARKQENNTSEHKFRDIEHRNSNNTCQNRNDMGGDCVGTYIFLTHLSTLAPEPLHSLGFSPSNFLHSKNARFASEHSRAIIFAAVYSSEDFMLELFMFLLGSLSTRLLVYERMVIMWSPIQVSESK